MKTHISLSRSLVPALALTVAGCFGSDPNMNSQLANPDAGRTGTGGVGSIDPAKPIVGMPVATFDTGLQGYIVDPYHDTNQKNLADPAIIGQRPNMEMPTLSFESGMGSPSPGSVKIVAPYFGASQFVQLEAMSFGTSNTRNWKGGKLHLRIQVIAGTFTGGAQVYVKTGSAYVFGGTYFNFPAGKGWQEFAMDVDMPMTPGTSGVYDPAEVITLGVQLNTGDSGSSAGPVTFLVDSFSIDLPAGGAGGSGGRGGGGGTGAGGASGSGTGGAGGSGSGGTNADASTGG
jgi:hypothetical protein